MSKSRFWDEFGKSNIISGLLALALWSAIIFLSVTGGPIPEVLVGGGLTVIAFFFGSKVGSESEKLRTRILGQELKERDYNAWLQSHGQ